MKEKFICKSLSFIMKYQECDDLKIKKLKYGLEGIYSMIVKFLVVVFIAIFTSTIKETLLLILFYAGIRTFSFGWHAKTNIGCWVTTLTIYNGLPFIIKYITKHIVKIGHHCKLIHRIVRILLNSFIIK